MNNDILRCYCIDIAFNKPKLQSLIVRTTINNEDVSFTIELAKPANKYCVEELFIIVRNNFIPRISLVENINMTDSDIKALYKYLFVVTVGNVKTVIEDRWLRDCNQGRVYCGEMLDLAIAPMGGIYQNTAKIETSDDLGSWQEMFDVDFIKSRSAEELYEDICYHLDYTQWVYDKKAIKELANLAAKKPLSLDSADVETSSKLEALKELLADEEKLNKLIGDTLPITAKDLLDGILIKTNNIIHAVERKDINKINVF